MGVECFIQEMRTVRDQGTDCGSLKGGGRIYRLGNSSTVVEGKGAGALRKARIGGPWPGRVVKQGRPRTRKEEYL